MKSKTVVAVATVLAASFAMVSTAEAQISTVTVRVDGLACPFCAYSLEKHIKAIDGTKSPVINIEQGIVTLTPADDKAVDFDAVREAVKQAGFTPREIVVEGVGRMETIGGRTTLIAEDGRELFVLAANDVLAGLEEGRREVVTFRGTVASRRKDDDRSTLRTLTLLSATPAAKGDVKK